MTQAGNNHQRSISGKGTVARGPLRNSLPHQFHSCTYTCSRRVGRKKSSEVCKNNLNRGNVAEQHADQIGLQLLINAKRAEMWSKKSPPGSGILPAGKRYYSAFKTRSVTQIPLHEAWSRVGCNRRSSTHRRQGRS